MNKTPNKRKSLAVSNETPSKLLKVGRSPKTPKSATKANGNKTPKTPKSAIKAAKKVEEDVTDESEENEESIVFNSDLNQESDEANSDAEAGEDSDAEVGDESDAEVDENSDAESENGENDNDGDDESEEENEDTDQEQDDDDEVDSENDEIPNENEKPLSVYVRGLPKEANLEDVFSGCEISNYEPQINEYDELLGYIVTFKNEYSRNIALFAKHETEYEGRIILVKPCWHLDEYFNISVKGLMFKSKLEQLFQGCKIDKIKQSYKDANKFLIKFADEESIQKALLKDETEFSGCKLEVRRLLWTVRVEGLESTEDTIKFFKGCDIASIRVKNMKRKNKTRLFMFVTFKDRKSLQKAVSLNYHEYQKKIITVGLNTGYKYGHGQLNKVYEKPLNNEPIKSRGRFNSRGRPFNNRPFNSRGRPLMSRPFNNRGRSFNNRPFNNRGRSFNKRPVNSKVEYFTINP